MTREERRWCLIFGLGVALATTLPYLWAFYRQGDAWRFSGFLFGVEDGNSYLAKMLQGSYGAWLFRTAYTTAPQKGILAFLPYLLLGKLTAGPALHEQLIALYHGARFLAIPWAVWATYSFSSRFLSTVGWRRWATVLATVGGGLGWILVALGKGAALGGLPLEFYSPESFGFLAYLGLPHLVAGRALLLSGLGWYLDACKKARSPLWAGGSFLLLGFFQPLAVVSAWVVMLAHSGLAIASARGIGREAARDTLRAGAGAAAASSPVVIYYAWVSFADPFVRAWNAQNIIRSPQPFHYLLAYGLMAAFAVLGVLRLKHGETWRLPTGWLLALPLLAYAPMNLQRRLPDGVWVAIVVLAAAGLETFRSRPARRMGLVVAAVTVPSCLILLAGAFRTADAPSAPAFIPSASAEAYEAVLSLAHPGDVVMASFETGNVLPAWAPVRVPMGHGPESVGLVQARTDVETFYAKGTSDSARQSLLAKYQIRFVLQGPSERALGAWDATSASYLTPVFASSGIRIFSVRGGAVPAAVGGGG